MTDPAVHAAEALQAGMVALKDEFKAWRKVAEAQLADQYKFGRRNRKLIRRQNVIGVIAMVAVVWAVVLTFVSVHTSHHADRNARIAQQAVSAAAQAKQNQINTCLSSNDARAKNRDLWEFIIVLSRKSNPHPTPAQAKRIADFQKQIDSTFAPRDCSLIK